MRLKALAAGVALLVLPSLAAPKDNGWTELFNGRDLSGWHLLKPDGPNLWKVEGGVYTTAAKGTDLQTDREFYNFQLHVEFKLVPGSNSGVYMRDRYEIQIADSYGKPPQDAGCGALYRRKAPDAVACRPAGKWETFDVTFVKQRLTVRHNGQKILAYTAEPGSPSHHALNLLASWTGTLSQPPVVHADEQAPAERGPQ